MKYFFSQKSPFWSDFNLLMIPMDLLQNCFKNISMHSSSYMCYYFKRAFNMFCYFFIGCFTLYLHDIVRFYAVALTIDYFTEKKEASYPWLHLSLGNPLILCRRKNEQRSMQALSSRICLIEYSRDCGSGKSEGVLEKVRKIYRILGIGHCEAFYNLPHSLMSLGESKWIQMWD